MGFGDELEAGEFGGHKGVKSSLLVGGTNGFGAIPAFAVDVESLHDSDGQGFGGDDIDCPGQECPSLRSAR